MCWGGDSGYPGLAEALHVRTPRSKPVAAGFETHPWAIWRTWDFQEAGLVWPWALCGFAEVFSGPLVVFRPQEEEEAQAEFGRDDQKDHAGPASEEGEKQPPRSQEKPAGEASAPEGQQEEAGEKGGSKVRPFLAGRGGKPLWGERASCPSGTGRWCLPNLCHNGLLQILVSP